MDRTRSSLDPDPPRTWVTFVLFLVTNLLLSYAPLSGNYAWILGIAGIGVPMAWGLFSHRAPRSGPPLHQRDLLPAVPIGAWVLLAVAALFLRFYHWSDLFVWPNGDEGNYASFAFSILRRGVRHFLYHSTQVPVFYPWWLSLQFKLWGPSAANLWFWPPFFSALTLPLGYWAVRRFFSRSFSILCVVVLGSSFLVLYLARFSVHTALIPLGEAGVLGLMGWAFSSSRTKERDFLSFFTGLALGLFLMAVYLHWLAVLAVVAMTFLAWGRNHRTSLGFFLLGLILTAVPFLVLALGQGLPSYVGYLGQSEARHGGISWFYLRGLFWGLPLSFYTYQPFWGGFLNPILVSLFFLGALEALRNFTDPLHRWFVLSFAVFLVPGLMSRDMEAYRILPVLAAVIPLVALGTARLLAAAPPRRTWLTLGLLFLPSASLDFHHLIGPSRQIWDSPDYWRRSVKSLTSYRAAGLLKEKAAPQGPGMVFQDFNPIDSDQTLSLATFPFDVLADRRRSFEEAHWAAVLVNVHYRPFLEKILGPGRAFVLTQDLPAPDGGRMLWVVPLNQTNRERLRSWYQADLALDPFRDAVTQDKGYFWGRPSPETFQLLESLYPKFQGDPCLRSFFWEKMADFDFKAGRSPEAIGCLEMALRQGVPSPHLYYRMGVLEWIEGNVPAARDSWTKATRLPMDLTQSRLMLDSPAQDPEKGAAP